jgi:hypothetical protein
MDLHALHTERRRLLNEVRGAEMSKQYELAAHLLDQFQKINHRVRDLEEVGYNKNDVKHDLAMMETAP